MYWFQYPRYASGLHRLWVRKLMLESLHRSAFILLYTQSFLARVSSWEQVVEGLSLFMLFLQHSCVWDELRATYGHCNQGENA